MFGQQSVTTDAVDTLKANQERMQETMAAVQKGLRQADKAVRSTVKDRPYHVTIGVLAAGFLLGALVPIVLRRRLG